MNYLVLLLPMMVGAAAVCVVLWMRLSGVKREALELRQKRDALAAQLDDERKIEMDCARRLAVAEAELRAARAEAEQRRKLAVENERTFSALAAQVLKQQRADLHDNEEQRLTALLEPLRLRLQEFQQRVENYYSAEARERFSMMGAVRDLIDQTQNIGREARDLTTALRGNSKVQGDWGEMILERLLERSGLEAGKEFVLQQTRDEHGDVIRDENGNLLRPDVVLYLPDNRAIVIDSKVTLAAYADWVNAADAEAREDAARRHVASVRAKINELRDRRYQDYLGKRHLDFVMMFMPVEGAYLSALSLDEGLWQYAFDNRVLMVSPTHLVSVLKLTAQLWSTEKQVEHAMAIATEAGRLHDKVAGFVDDMESINKKLAEASAAWENAMNKLSRGKGNVLGKTDKLRQMGAKTQRRLNAPDPGD